MSAGDPPDHAAVQAASLEIARAAVRVGTVEGIAEVIARVATDLVGGDRGTVGLVQDDEVETLAVYLAQPRPIRSRLPVGFGVAGWVAATGVAAEIQDLETDRRYVTIDYPQPRSMVALPLRTERDVVGVLSVSSHRTHAFAHGTAERMSGLAEHAALAMRQVERHQAITAQLHDVQSGVEAALAERLHGLKGTLNTAAGFLSLLDSDALGPLDEGHVKAVRLARSQTQRAASMARSLLDDLASLDRRSLRRRLQSAHALAQVAIRAVEGEAAAAGVRVEWGASEGAAHVLADEEAVGEILLNVLQNAIRVTPRGSSMAVSVQTDTREVHIVVDDQGPGLAGARAEELFTRHVQGPAGRGSAGLGLWISRRLAERQGGRLWAEPRDEGGARFVLALPRADV